MERYANWGRAITLSERISLRRTAIDAAFTSEVDEDHAAWLLRQWKSQPPFDTETYFEQRLAVAGLTENEFYSLVGERPEVLGRRLRTIPAWMVDLEEIFYPADARDDETTPIPDASGNRAEAQFLKIIDPLIARGRRRLSEGIKGIAREGARLPVDLTRIEETLLLNLPSQLIKALSPAVVLELNIARLQGLLEGATAEERFESFLKRSCQPIHALAFLREYPVLARQVVNMIDKAVDTGLEFLRRLCGDWEAICAKFSPGAEPGKLTELKSGIGDKHRGGRAVMIAKFSSGFQVVYKPRSLSVDVHFQQLLRWLNQKGDHPPFRTLNILERDDYGWEEFVTAEACASVAEVRRFYQRQGGYLALLYALEAVDFHYENLIAVGEHPVLIDLESLFHPYALDVDARQSEMLAGDIMGRSVLRVGLLPQRRWATEDSDGVDLSGLGAEPGQVTPFGVPYWDRAGRDEMRIAHRRAEAPVSNNRPSLNGEALNVIDHTEEILSGFTGVYKLIEKYQDELLADDGPLACFAEDEVRVILRPTQKYSALLGASFHPDLLGDSIARDLYFDRLWLGHPINPHLIKVVAEEQEDLLNGDIPIFTTRPASCDLWCSRKKRVAGFFKESGLSLVRRRARRMNEQDLAQQLWFIQSSIATLSADFNRVKRPAYPPPESIDAVARERLLAAARAVGDRLGETALRGESDLTWIGLSLTRRGAWSLSPLEIDFYDGLPGIAMFLAYLGKITREDCYSKMARDVVATVRRLTDRRKQSLTKIGCFDGWGGVIYMLAHLGALWDDRRLFIEAGRAAEFLATQIEKDKYFDIISGAAGGIMALLSLYRSSRSDHALATAIKCGDHLIAHAQQMKTGTGWKTIAQASEPLAGFAHGAAGIALSLIQLGAVTGEKRFETAALSAIDYERSLFSPEFGNWPDLRNLESPGFNGKGSAHDFMTAWCHGAPGIGIARLTSLPFLNDAAIKQEIAVALKTTIARGFGASHCLCHGDLGSLEFLLQASRKFDDPQLRLQLDRMVGMVIGSIDTDGWLCGAPMSLQPPGLMTGIAGIGYELLRLAEPARLPSALSLDSPYD